MLILNFKQFFFFIITFLLLIQFNNALDSSSIHFEKREVVVIGGGMTGIQTANTLYEQGVDVMVLEQNDYLGGRIKSKSLNNRDFDFDAGAQYVGREQQLVMKYLEMYSLLDQLVDTYQLVQQGEPYHVEVFNNNPWRYRRSDTYLGNGGVPSSLGYQGLYALTILLAKIDMLERVIDTQKPWQAAPGMPPEVDEFIARLDNITVDEWINEQHYLPIDEKLLYRFAAKAAFSIDVTKMSALFYLWYGKSEGGFLQMVNDQDDGPQQYFLKGGMKRLVDAMAQNLLTDNRIRLNQRIEKVQRDGSNKMFVSYHDLKSGEQKVIRADRIVVAMSPTAAGKIHFEEGIISPERKLLHSQQMGKTIKTFATYDEKWWQQEDNPRIYSGYVGTGDNPHDYTHDNVTVMWCMDNTIAEKNMFTVMSFIIADEVDKVTDENGCYDEELLQQVIGNHLGYFFENPPKALNMSSWTSDVWTKKKSDPWATGGPVTVMDRNVLSSVRDVFRNPQERDLPLYFAASEYANVFPGYINGALDNGLKVSNAILTSLNKSTVEIPQGARNFYFNRINQKPKPKDWYRFKSFENSIQNFHVKTKKHNDNHSNVYQKFKYGLGVVEGLTWYFLSQANESIQRSYYDWAQPSIVFKHLPHPNEGVLSNIFSIFNSIVKFGKK
eukprot:gb/GECH01011707.1/.p1 GENE.gb/GECH01011707.1/~~gb/GECH01011707.1/.p1  ORF type:complete len:665 (+),score=175.59 gb/GECH01011707.1/:1-1995(+)